MVSTRTRKGTMPSHYTLWYVHDFNKLWYDYAHGMFSRYVCQVTWASSLCKFMKVQLHNLCIYDMYATKGSMVFYVRALLLFTKQLAFVFKNIFKKSIRGAIEGS